MALINPEVLETGGPGKREKNARETRGTKPRGMMTFLTIRNLH